MESGSGKWYVLHSWNGLRKSFLKVLLSRFAIISDSRKFQIWQKNKNFIFFGLELCEPYLSCPRYIQVGLNKICLLKLRVWLFNHSNSLIFYYIFNQSFFDPSLFNLILFNFIAILYIFKHRHLHCPWQHLGPRLESLGFYWTSAKVLKKYVSISDQSTKNKLILEGCMWN